MLDLWLCLMLLHEAKQINIQLRRYISERVLPHNGYKVPGALQVSRYAVLNPNANFRRPLLVVASARDFGVYPLNHIFPAAAAVELVHAASLILDDMDDKSPIRRKKRSCHVAFGNPTARHAVSYLVNRANELLLSDRLNPNLDYEKRVKTVSLAARVGNIMIEGQEQDVSQTGETIEDAIEMYEKKSGALFGLALAAGGLIGSANPDDIAYLEQLGNCLGVSYQLADDKKDFLPLSKTGKPAGQDTGKKTLLRILGPKGVKKLSESKDREADELLGMLSVEPINLKGLIDSIRMSRSLESIV